MTLSELKAEVSQALLEFAWDEWAQIGVFASPRRRSPWTADPEAHLLFSLQVGRDDPRLFDEILDWWSLNARLISVQRFRNMFGSDADRRLGEAALGWVNRTVNGARTRAGRPTRSEGVDEPLFYGMRVPSNPDETFLQFGFLKPFTKRTRKSSPPDPRQPINFAFLLRYGFGVGSRAEVLRFLLTANVPSPFGSRPIFTTLAIADAAAFAKRNVQETLHSLVEAGWVERTIRGNEHLYALDPEPWRAFLRMDEIPQYRDWTNALHAFRELHRWLHRAEVEDYSPYMLASEARRLIRAIEPSLRYAGIALSWRDAAGPEYWEVFVGAVEQMLASLASGIRW